MEAVWDVAVRASGLDPEQVHLLPIPGAAVRGFNQAVCYPPGDLLIDDPEDLIRGNALDEANSSEHIRKHRIAIYEDVDPDDPFEVALLGAKLRHELRHAEQHEACGKALLDLDELAGDVILWKAGGLPRSNSLYHMKPMEIDANAASAEFVREAYPGQVEALLESEDGVLARSNTPAGDLLDLPAQTVAFLFLFRSIAEDPDRVDSGLAFRDRLRLIGQQWADLWMALASGRLEAPR
jgi:hypothetical protein